MLFLDHSGDTFAKKALKIIKKALGLPLPREGVARCAQMLIKPSGTATLNDPIADTLGTMAPPEIVLPLWFSKQLLFQKHQEWKLQIVSGKQFAKTFFSKGIELCDKRKGFISERTVGDPCARTLRPPTPHPIFLFPCVPDFCFCYVIFLFS